jgi:hypothetical protein
MKQAHRSLREQLKSLLTMILVGAFAGNLLAALTGGFSIAESASASSATTNQAATSELHFTLNPSHPEFLRAVEFKVLTQTGSVPTVVTAHIQGLQAGSFACSTLDEGAHWSCPVPGISVADATQLSITAE